MFHRQFRSAKSAIDYMYCSVSVHHSICQPRKTCSETTNCVTRLILKPVCLSRSVYYLPSCWTNHIASSRVASKFSKSVSYQITVTGCVEIHQPIRNVLETSTIRLAGVVPVRRTCCCLRCNSSNEVSSLFYSKLASMENNKLKNVHESDSRIYLSGK